MGLTENNYYLRDDGLMIFVTKIDALNFFFRVITPDLSGFFLHREEAFDYMSNVYDYKLIDHEYGKKLEKFLTL
jgi:hypothetical protein